MRNSKAYIAMRLMKLTHYVVSILLFVLAWNTFLSIYEITIAVRYWWFVVLAYGILEYYFNRVYNGYMVEFSNKNDIAFSLSLSSCISALGIYVISIIAWNKFYAPWVFLVLMVVEIVWNIIWSGISVSTYSKTGKPLTAAIVYRNSTDLERIAEVFKYNNKYDVSVMVENPVCIFEVIEAIRECKAVFVTGVNASLRNGVAKYCMEKDIQGFFLPHVGDIIMNGSEHVQAFRVPIMRMQSVNSNIEYGIAKRIADILIAFIALVIAAPVMIVCSICIKLEDGGTVLYKQTRLTTGGREFQILKFRSMRMDAESDGIARLSTGDNDERITKVGRVLRTCRFDEIPQLFNILKGEMTIVGPRPERPEIAAHYKEVMPSFDLRLKVKAGLTGYAQVYGRYNTDPHDKLEMDLMYINQMNILTDIKLMFATVRVLFMKESTEGISKGKMNALDED